MAEPDVAQSTNSIHNSDTNSFETIFGNERASHIIIDINFKLKLIPRLDLDGIAHPPRVLK